jgi:hypothetical protein
VPLASCVPVDPVHTRTMVQLGSLERLVLCVVRRPNKELGEVVRLIGDDMRRVHLDTRTVVEPTELGRAFIAGCTPPGQEVEASDGDDAADISIL